MNSLSPLTGNQFVPGYDPDADPAQARYVVLLEDQQVLSTADDHWQPLSADTWRFAPFQPTEQHHIGYYNSAPCFAVRVTTESPVPAGFQWESLRSLMVRGAVGEAEFALAGAGLQVFNWDRDHQYCGRCGSPTHYHPRERARICEHCNKHDYPRLSPCVITLVTRGEECLLARHAKHKAAFHSPIAGFIEPGESVENALHREVAEEVAIEVGDLRYFGSQPWPFPGQLMIGFHASYVAGEIHPDGVEIAEANWWHYRDLPSVPGGGSLSGRLIQQFVEQCKKRE